MYFSEALKEFAALSEAEHDLWKKQESKAAKQVAYENFCKQAL